MKRRNLGFALTQTLNPTRSLKTLQRTFVRSLSALLTFVFIISRRAARSHNVVCFA